MTSKPAVKPTYNPTSDELKSAISVAFKHEVSEKARFFCLRFTLYHYATFCVPFACQKFTQKAQRFSHPLVLFYYSMYRQQQSPLSRRFQRLFKRSIPHGSFPNDESRNLSRNIRPREQILSRTTMTVLQAIPPRPSVWLSVPRRRLANSLRKRAKRRRQA